MNNTKTKSLARSQFPCSLFCRRLPGSWLLYVTMFLIGACGIAYQYTLSKVSSDLLGNSARQWALVIGVMMFFMGFGADLQKRIDRHRLLFFFILFEILLSLLGAFSPLILLFTFAGAYDYFMLLLYTLIALIGLLIGCEIPLISRINEQYVRELGVNIGSVLKMDYVGSLAGALLWTFWLLPNISLFSSAFILGLITLTAAFMPLIFFYRHIRGRRLLIGLLALALFANTIGLINAKRLAIAGEQHIYRDLVVLSQTTPYQHIVVTRSGSGNLRLYINGHLQFNQQDEHIYHENLVHPAMLQANKRDRVLILGGGDGLALREILKYRDVAEVILCDLDPYMTRLAANDQYLRQLNQDSLKDSRLTIVENGALLAAPMHTVRQSAEQPADRHKPYPLAEVQLVNIDARLFLEQIEGTFDVIIADFPDPNSENLARLYDYTFYQLIRSRLSAGGILAQQATSPYHSRRAFLSVGKTMRAAGLSAYPYHDNVPSFGEWGWYLAAGQPLQADIFDQIAIPVELSYLTGPLINAAFKFGRGMLDDSLIEVTRLSNNKIFYYYIEAVENF